MKINFTKQHFERLQELALEMLFNNSEIQNKIGVPLNIVEVLHTTTINQLNEIKSLLSKKIERIESQDEWTTPDSDQLTLLRKKKELVNLVVGWKRHIYEIKELQEKKEKLSAQIAQLKESQKTPEDRIKEMEVELASIEEVEDFQ